MARLLERYRNEIIPQMQKAYNFKNAFQVPCLKKIVINMGVGEAARDGKLIDDASAELALITGQRPLITKSRKSIAGFKIRADIPIGCKVTIRGKRMYEFLDRFISVVVPRIRDFRGFPANSFDNNGNYSFGLDEQTVFPELELDKVKRTQGMDITIVTSTKSDKEAKGLLDYLGFPFARISQTGE